MRLLLTMLLGLAAALVAPAVTIPARPLEVYDRAGTLFTLVSLWKPVPAGETNPVIGMAPLLLQELDDTTNAIKQASGQRANGLSTLVLSNRTLTLDYARPAVYYEVDAVEFRGRAHARYTYMWCYTLSSKAGSTAVPMQGVRITLDSRGYPCIWEVLADHSRQELIYVSRSLEEAARAQYREALPGRKFAVERRLEDARATVVARVIEDGPVPMGPILYLEKNSRSVMTLICRCMPSQASTVVETREYELVPASIAPRESPLSRARQMSGLHPAFWNDTGKAEARVARVLRLPDTF